MIVRALVIACLLGAVALAGCAPRLHQAGPAASMTAQVVDSIASAFFQEGNVPGFSIGVLQGNDVLFARGYGFADLEHGVPATWETVYRIGSLTKPFTAAAVLQLAERRLLDLDDPIARFFPDYPAPGSAVTIRQLLNMTSGIPNYTMDPRLDYFRDELPHDSVVGLFRDRPLLFAPGERYDYSNSNFYLLGLVIEKLSGMPYGDYIREHIVEPLGLAATRYCTNRPLIEQRAAGYRRVDDAWVNARPVSVAWAYAAGGLCSTAADQVRWIRALHQEGALIGAASFAGMATKTQLVGGAESGYGFGMAVDELGGHTHLSHAGNLDGFRASISYFPADSLAVVVLTNTEGPGAADLKERVARKLLGVRSLTAADVADLPLTAEERRRYLGVYALETVALRFTVSEADGAVQLSMGGQTPMPLLYQGNHRFLIATDLESSLEFTVADGLATHVLVRSATGNVFSGTRVP